jgi:amino acid transporter
MLVGIVFLFLSLAIAKVGIGNEFTMTFINGQKIELQNILMILSIAPMLYVGFDCIPQVAEELDFAAEDASKLAIFSILVGALIYCSILFFTSFGVTLDDVTNGKISWATGHTVEYYFGKIGLWSLALALLSAIIAGINGFYMASSRLLFAMARGKILPEFIGKLDPKYHTPKNAILFILAISLIAPWFGRNVLGWIVGTSSVGASIGYLYTSLSSYKLYKAEHGRVYLPSIFGSVAGVIFLILLLTPGLKSSLSMPSAIIVFVWGLIGYSFYRFYDLQVVHYTVEELDELILNRDKDGNFKEN